MFPQSPYFLPLIFIAVRMVLFSICSFGGQKNQKPRHTESAVGSFFVHKLPVGNIPQSNEPCPSSLSYVFRVLWNSFSYPRDACITSSQTILALYPKNIRALTVHFNGAGGFKKLLLLSNKQCKGNFQKNTALSKSQATAAVKGAEKSVKVFLRAVAQLNFHTPA